MRDEVPALQTAPRPLFGIGLKVLSVVVFVTMQSILKWAGEGLPAGQMVFFRSFFAVIPVLLLLAWMGELKTAFITQDLPGHMVRGFVGVGAMGCGFYALTRLPYPEWVTISYASPLLTVIFAVIFLKEVVRAYRWFAVAIGLFGILVVTVPTFAGASVQDSTVAIAALAALAGAMFSAIAMIQIRRLVRKERTATIVVYFSLTSSALTLLTLPFGWVLPNPSQAALLVTAGLLGGVGQLLLTACYRYADTSTIAPFEYTSLILAILIGYVIFDEAVGVTTLVGGAIVVSAGIFIILRERRLGIERALASARKSDSISAKPDA